MKKTAACLLTLSAGMMTFSTGAYAADWAWCCTHPDHRGARPKARCLNTERVYENRRRCLEQRDRHDADRPRHRDDSTCRKVGEYRR
jgi:hypothetical protein